MLQREVIGVGNGPGAAASIAELIRARLPEMTPSERRVARALTGTPTAGLESSLRLAALAEVSGPTVSRFAQRLGFDNYAAFQQALRDDVAARMLSPIEVYRQYETAEPGRDVLRNSADALGRALDATLGELTPESLGRAAEVLADPRRQVWTAGG